MGSFATVAKLGGAFRSMGEARDRALRLFAVEDSPYRTGPDAFARGGALASAASARGAERQAVGRLAIDQGKPFKSTAPRILQDLILKYGQGLREHMVQINLDAERCYLSDEVIADGKLSHLIASYRPIVASAVVARASCIVLVHNHPSGNVMPSRTDCVVTRRIAAVLRTLEVALEDHVIVTSTRAYSMRKAGLL